MRFLEDTVEELTMKGECMVISDFNLDLGFVLCEEIANDSVKLRYETVC